MQINITNQLPLTPYGEPLFNLLPLASRSPSRDETRSPVGFYKSVALNGKVIQIHRAVFILAGVKVPKGYETHHINGNRFDNRPLNLAALPMRFHVGIHHKTHKLVAGVWYKKCGECKKWLKLENNFYRRTRPRDNAICISSRCIPCRSEYDKEHYVRKKMSVKLDAET